MQLGHPLQKAGTALQLHDSLMRGSGHFHHLSHWCCRGPKMHCIAYGNFSFATPRQRASPHCSRSQPRFGQRLADFANYSARCASVFSPVAGYSARGATCDSRDPKYPSMAATSTFQKMVTMMSLLSTRSSLTSSKHSMTSFWLYAFPLPVISYILTYMTPNKHFKDVPAKLPTP